MFERFVLRRSKDGPELTAGDVAEALLFYQSVHLVLDHGTLSQLIKSIGMEQILALLDRPGVSAVYCEETLGTLTTQAGNLPKYGFVAFTLVGDKTGGTFNSRTERIALVLRNNGVAAAKAAKLAEKFRKKVPIRKLSDDSFVSGGIIQAAKSDLQDSAFVNDAMRCVLRFEPNALRFPQGFKFDVVSVDDGFHVFTDLDFPAINIARRAINANLDELTSAHLIGNILEARCDLSLAAHYGGDFQTAERTSSVIRLRFADILRRTGIHRDQLNAFQEIVVPDMPTIKFAIDRGARSFDEFLRLRDHAWRFRGWLSGVNPDEKLVAAYLAQVTREQWVASVPVRVGRFVIGKAVDAVAPTLGHVLSGVDALLLEKFCEGWRPNHFVDNKLLPFLAGSEN